MKLLVLCCLVVLLPFGCMEFAEATSISQQRDETRNVGEFHAVANSGSIVVEVKVGEHESVRLEGNEEAIREIETVVESGTLKIRYKRGIKMVGRNWGKVTAYVTAKRIDGLSQSGSGSITVMGKITGNKLNTSLSGSGRIVFETDVAVCNASISGSGRMSANGNAKESNVSISGSGQFEGSDLRSQSANLKISGSGNIRIHANDQLDAAISGSGNIHYSGNARTNVKTSGSGKVRKI
ncbi:head GIN domain-containing protein [Parapedobacter tibetensis]|uniref:head GIN domain-containing protein n=1 Tax=Parapedobacter tibetensis TaxID=2972951 RepID=UPI00214D725F|nr:head GIN domain-containing protein [Parapedobacter tibetensis]